MNEKKHLQSDEAENPVKEPNEPVVSEPSPEDPNPYPVTDPIPEPIPEPFPVPPEPIPEFPPVIPY
ncbi:MAG TPA: hypothetical protein PKY82_07970 [Pyrinomonadaceae bacterium]|nr:hypothetical protein [Pyrinomonadaceae bacterium]